jgi:hypothetical protein
MLPHPVALGCGDGEDAVEKTMSVMVSGDDFPDSFE